MTEKTEKPARVRAKTDPALRCAKAVVRLYVEGSFPEMCKLLSERWPEVARAMSERLAP